MLTNTYGLVRGAATWRLEQAEVVGHGRHHGNEEEARDAKTGRPHSRGISEQPVCYGEWNEWRTYEWG